MFGRRSGASRRPGDFMLLERGNATLAPGTRVAVYRDLHRRACR